MSTPADLLEGTIRDWVDDPESDVEYAERVEGRWAVRVRQTVRDATTVWWTVGQRTVAAEAYVLPLPDPPPASALRLCMVRNRAAWRSRFFLDAEGAVMLGARVAVEELTTEVLDAVLGELYASVESTFRPLLATLSAPSSASLSSRETIG